jgi:hypothetical protein
VIDPVFSYSTLLGGMGADVATAIAVDASGAAYVTGFTESLNLPVVNAEQASNHGNVDVFVAKLNAAGTQWIYCTYLGGRAADQAYGIAVDATGAAYVAGSTSSSDFPVASGIQSQLKGSKDAFIFKLNPAGSALIFSTHLGGSKSSEGNAIALDSQMNLCCGRHQFYGFSRFRIPEDEPRLDRCFCRQVEDRWQFSPLQHSAGRQWLRSGFGRSR